jgi:hypothetical protein
MAARPIGPFCALEAGAVFYEIEETPAMYSTAPGFLRREIVGGLALKLPSRSAQLPLNSRSRNSSVVTLERYQLHSVHLGFQIPSTTRSDSPVP